MSRSDREPGEGLLGVRWGVVLDVVEFVED
jgi:hypothetical protein